MNSSKLIINSPILHRIITILHNILTSPRLIRFEREGMRKNYRGNIANETNMLGCITFATRHGVVVGVSFHTYCFVGVDSRILRTGVLRQWEARG